MIFSFLFSDAHSTHDAGVVSMELSSFSSSSSLRYSSHERNGVLAGGGAGELPNCPPLGNGLNSKYGMKAFNKDKQSMRAKQKFIFI